MHVGPVSVQDPEVRGLLDALTAELAEGGYSPGQTFGYAPAELEAKGVRLLGVRMDTDPEDVSTGLPESPQGRLVGVGGVELLGDVAELKRCYVMPAHRGTGVAHTLLTALIVAAAEQGARVLRLETGNQQHAALTFYRRHGFTDVPRFGSYVRSATSVCLARPLLERFVLAQQDTYAGALSELRAGRKTGHWMWFVFPQLAGLGRTATAQHYAIASLAEALAYAEHPVLGQRLREASRVVRDTPTATAPALLGEVDALKLRSSMTLFATALPDEPVFDAVLARFYDGPDARTLSLLNPARP